MIIKSVHIEKFRGFKDVNFDIGNQVTIIAGQNGTQKTTLLGMLSQPFSLRGHSTMKDAMPLCGGNFISGFADKFKLSTTYDIAGSHEWTLNLHNNPEPFTVASMKRDAKSGQIRFWKKGDRSKGSGYIQLPVIFLSLKRLFPIGEDNKISQSTNVVLTEEENKAYKDLHNQILISLDTITQSDYLESQHKNTLGVNTDHYDWMQNSAGQDNIGKIILALLSFQRLKKDYPNDYKGGLLVIDELDATMYPASQQKLLTVLRTYASKLNIQIIFTTHSLSLLEQGCKLQSECDSRPATASQVKVLFLEKKDKSICVNNSCGFETIKNRLNVAVSKKTQKNVAAFTEDKEAQLLIRGLLGTKCGIQFVDVNISCSTLIDLVYRKIPSFCYPQSIVFLDGDVTSDASSKKKLGKAQNVVILPSNQSPERLLANYLNSLSDADPLWVQINPDYSKQVCFRDYTLAQINSERVQAKKWFNAQRDEVGTGWNGKVISRWKRDNKAEFDKFNDSFKKVYSKFA